MAAHIFVDEVIPYMFGWVDRAVKFFVWLDGQGPMETKLIN
jgi:hypothetical protein